MDRDAALDRVEAILRTVETDPMPVPVREVWVYGDVALGLDPVERLDVYVTKDILLRDEEADAAAAERHGVRGVGRTVSAEWAERFPEHLRANDSGHAAPERCLAAHLLPDDEPVHLEVCNAPFEDNVTQRLEGALARDAYGEVLDPRGVCLWVDGTRAEESLERLRDGDLPFPTLPDALEMLGADGEAAAEAAEAVRARRLDQDGASVRGDVV
ncbi:MAG: hypothetical protein ABEH40_09480 [Haloferacaceae archaeon]